MCLFKNIYINGFSVGANTVRPFSLTAVILGEIYTVTTTVGIGFHARTFSHISAFQTDSIYNILANNVRPYDAIDNL